jgi:regulator of protease activity HflC (stomatin/prohibitin superfamily)
MFNDIVPGSDNTVSFKEVYNVYGKMAVRNKTREIISQYTVEDVHKNYSRLSKQIGVVLEESLKSTPLEISDISLGSIEYPDVVTEAIGAAKERELAIKKEQAQAEIELTKKKNERLLAEADYQIEITRAKAIRDKNKIIGEGVTEELLRLRALEVQEAMATNGAAVFMPYEAMATAGAQVRMFSK